MKKIIKWFILILFSTAILAAGIITYKGISLYDSTMKEIEITEVIDSIKESDDYVLYDEIAISFLDTIVTVEDKRFFEHNGFDIISFTRAIIRNIVEKEFAAGGSTITQQLAKNLFFSFDKTLERKVAEYFVAKELEQLYDKEELLEIYVNVIYYGDHYDGIKSASEGYFGVLPSELTMAQSVLLAGLPQAPSLYALSEHFDAAVTRSNKVLEVLLEQKKITAEELLKLQADIELLNVK